MSKTRHKCYVVITFIAVLLGCLFAACSSDEPDKPKGSDGTANVTEADIPGLWYGRHVYKRSNGSYGEQFLSVWFYDDHTGKLEYETPTSIGAGVFTWEFSKNKINCFGGYASSVNETGEVLDICFRIEGNRLYPEEKFQSFVLTTDGSVEIYDGKEVTDQSDLLQQEWISSDGLTIIWPYSKNEFYYYELSSPYGKFKTFEKGDYVYSYRNSTLQLDFIKDKKVYRQSNYSIESISNKELILSISNRKIAFKPYDIVPEEDKDENNNGNTSETKSDLSNLIGIMARCYYDDALKNVVANLKFDTKGRVVQYEDNYGYTITYKYGVNKIVKNKTNASGTAWVNYTYILSNGLVTQINERKQNYAGTSGDWETTISYNGNKVSLVQTIHNGNITECSIKWSSTGDISEVSKSHSDRRFKDRTTYTYLSSETLIPQFSPFGCENDYVITLDAFLWAKGYFGDLPKHIMKSKYYAYSYDGTSFKGGEQININTTLDNNNRIVRQVLNEKNLESNETQSNTIQFNWK